MTIFWANISHAYIQLPHHLFVYSFYIRVKLVMMMPLSWLAGFYALVYRCWYQQTSAARSALHFRRKSTQGDVFMYSHIYAVPACRSMCIVLGACLLLCLWASPRPPLFYESDPLPVFFYCCLYSAVYLVAPHMLHALRTQTPDPRI